MNYKKGEILPRRDTTAENILKTVVKTADRPKGSGKEKITGSPITSKRNQDNGHSYLSQDMETSTGETISKNGIRLWGMW